METLGTTRGVPEQNRRRAVIEKARAKGKTAASKKRQKLSPEAQKRVSEKVEHLIESGEFPNTEEGRRKALGTAYGMERAGRLRRGGKYVKKGK